MDTLIEREVRAVESGFPCREAVTQAQEASRAMTEALLRFPELGNGLQALREADNLGIATSRLLLPASCKGIALFAEWMHEDPKSGRMSERAVAVHTELLRLFHLLRGHGSTGPLCIEGPPREFRFQKYAGRTLPGTDIDLYGDDAQETLRRNPHLLRALIEHTPDTRTKVFPQFLSPRVLGDVRGIEREESHRESGEDLRHIAANLGALLPDDLRLINGMLHRQTGFRHPAPFVCCFGEYEIPLSELISRCERYVSAIERHARMQERRDGELSQCMEESIAGGRFPIVLCGQGHSIEVRRRCAEKGIGLLLVSPSSLPPLTDTYFQYALDARNTNYHIITHILPQLRAIRDTGGQNA